MKDNCDFREKEEANAVDNATYKQFRKQGVKAYVALKWARQKAKLPKLDWKSDGYRLTAEWGNNPRFVATVVESSDYIPFDECEWEWSRHKPGPLWFRVSLVYPTLSCIKPLEDRGIYLWARYPIEEAKKYYHKQGESRGVAYFKAIQEAKQYLRRVQRCGIDWCYVDMQVSVYVNGVEMGTSALVGIESDADHEYLTELALDLAQEALNNAKEYAAKVVEAAASLVKGGEVQWAERA